MVAEFRRFLKGFLGILLGVGREDLGGRWRLCGSGGVGYGGGGCFREKESEVVVGWWGLWVRRVAGV